MIKCPACDQGALFLKETFDRLTIFSDWRLFKYLGSTCQCGDNDKLNRIYWRSEEDIEAEAVFCYEEAAVDGAVLREMDVESLKGYKKFDAQC